MELFSRILYYINYIVAGIAYAMLASCILIVFANLAFASSCGPKVEFEIYKDIDNDDKLYGDYDRSYNQDESSHGFSLTLEIPLGTHECDKIDAQTLKEKADAKKRLAEEKDRRADAMDQKIKNLERIIRICKNPTNTIRPLCDRIPNLAAEINLD